MLPDPIKKFIDIFQKLPSIGPRQATRLAFYLISTGQNNLEEISNLFCDLKNINICKNCFFIHSNADGLCNICKDEKRNKNLIMILEKETDLISIERMKKFNGRYLVLGEMEKSGVLDAPQKLRLSILKDHIRSQCHSEPAKNPVDKNENLTQIDEIIIATNPTTYGDLNAMIIKKELEGYAKKFTRLGRGIPTGGEIEFADVETLEQALERRI